MTELAALNIRITGDSKDLQAALAAANGDLAKMVAGAEAAGLKVQQFGNKVKGAGAGMSHTLRGVSQQLSQVGQQTMATGNFVQALAIQLPDIGLAFGAIGTAAGLLAGTALPLIMSAFDSAGAKGKTFEDAIDGIKAAQDGLIATQDILKMSIPELYEQYGIYAASVRDAAASLAELQIAEAQVQLANTVYAGADALDRFAGSAAGVFSSGVTMSSAIANINRELGVSGQAATDLYRAFGDLQSAMSFEDRVGALSRIKSLLDASGVSASKLPPELRKALIEANQAEIAMAGLKKETIDAATATAAIGANAPGAGWLSGAIGDAVTLAGALWDAAKASAYARSGATGEGGPAFERGGRSGSSSGVSLADVKTIDDYMPAGIGGGGGGGGAGGGGVNPVISELEALQESLMTQEAAQIESYTRQQETLRSALDQRLITQQEYAAMIEQVQSQHEQKIGEIQATAQAQRLSETSGLFGALASIAEVGGKRMAKAAAAFQAIEGTVNAYGAALKALNTPGIGLAGRFAAYASVLAAGLKGVAAIRSAGGIGGGGGSAAAIGGGSSVASASAVQAGASQGPLQVSLSTFGVGDFLARADLGGLLDSLNKAAGDRGYRIMVPA